MNHDDNERANRYSLERMAAAIEANKPGVKTRRHRKHSKRRTTKVVNVTIVNTNR